MTERLYRALAGLALATAAGCTNSPKVDQSFAHGEYGQARHVIATHLQQQAAENKSDRDYVYNRQRLLMACLADGQAASAETTANEVFDLLSIQGLNKDRTTWAAITVDQVEIWKGEPFEQAMGYYYVALQKALTGDWDSVQAAASNSLFRLKDFGANEDGSRKTTEEIAQEAQRRENAASHEKDPDQADTDYLDYGYQPIETNFALGYLMTGLAWHVKGEHQRASDNFSKAVSYNAALDDVVKTLTSGTANTLLFVDYGLGPQKVRYGMDGAFSKFVPRYPSANRPLRVSIDGGPAMVIGQACDLNAMAQDHLWNNMEDVRVAKSVIGTALVAGGAAVAASSDNEGAQWAGLGMIIAGMIMKATAAADITYCELMPQGVYVTPLYIAEDDTTIELSVGDDPGSRMVLAGVNRPTARDGYQALFARLVPSGAAPAWARSGELYYAPPGCTTHVPGPHLPYILGGICVRPPNEQALRDYQSAGYLAGWSLNDLQDLYRQEGIFWNVQDQDSAAALHVLEGGNSLVSPLPGTAGFARLYGQPHPAYQPRTEICRDARAEVAPMVTAQDALARPGT